MFSDLAILGPIVTGGLGVAQQCLGCYYAQGRLPQEPRCSGFGPGCLGYRPIVGRAAHNRHQGEDMTCGSSPEPGAGVAER
jgi:hypothetical protein